MLTAFGRDVAIESLIVVVSAHIIAFDIAEAVLAARGEGARKEEKGGKEKDVFDKPRAGAKLALIMPRRENDCC